MRNRLTILGFGAASVLVIAAGACNDKGEQQCPDEELVCPRATRELVCQKFLTGIDAELIAPECCTFGTDASGAPAGLDASKPAATDAAAGPADAALPEVDAATAAPDAGSGAKDGGPAGKDAGKSAFAPLGDCGDGGWPYEVDAGWFYSLFDAGLIPPQGLDDAGGVHVYQCYVDVCNPPQWSWDGGMWTGDAGLGLWWLNRPDASRSNCGPTGCQP